MNNSPCFGCQKRTSTCHAECEEYRSYKQSNDENREKVFQERQKTNQLRSYHVDLARRIRKRKGKFA